MRATAEAANSLRKLFDHYGAQTRRKTFQVACTRLADTVTIAMAEPAPLKRSGTEVLASLEGDEIKVVQVASENQVAALQKALKWCVEQMQGQREENECAGRAARGRRDRRDRQRVRSFRAPHSDGGDGRGD